MSGVWKSAEELERDAAAELARISSIQTERPLKTRDRLQIPAQDMPAQDPHLRGKNMTEVALGYTPSQARVEAERCLQCPTAPCIAGCPVSIDIPRFIAKIAEGKTAEALNVIQESSLLPAICGRVCPQEIQCQEACTVGKSLKSVEKAVNIGRLERWVADTANADGSKSQVAVIKDSGKSVAIVGSGPAGIAAAADLRKSGHRVVLFEAFHRPGGVLIYGIPEFRLPKQIVSREIQNLIDLGVEVQTNFLIGRTRKLSDLLSEDKFDAVFIGVGAGLPKFMHIEGEQLVGVFSANEYLTRANMMKAYDAKAATPIWRSRKVAVLGGGNVAMDAARMALRIGAEEVSIVYRRSELEMPARREEVLHAQEEGIKFLTLHNAQRIIGDEQGRVKSVELLRYELGEPDSSGRRKPIPVKGSESTAEFDTVIIAIGNETNPLLRQTEEGLQTDDRGRVQTDEHGRTSLKGVYAGGDIVLGAATVILAMGMGRRSAAAINAYLSDDNYQSLWNSWQPHKFDEVQS